MKDSIKTQIEDVLRETTQFDFPFLADQKKKEDIIVEKRLYIEEQLKKVAPKWFPDENTLKEIWDKSIEYADAQFKVLSGKNRLNGFYLQELLHCYAEKIGQCIMNGNEGDWVYGKKS